MCLHSFSRGFAIHLSSFHDDEGSYGQIFIRKLELDFLENAAAALNGLRQTLEVEYENQVLKKKEEREWNENEEWTSFKIIEFLNIYGCTVKESPGHSGQEC